SRSRKWRARQPASGSSLLVAYALRKKGPYPFFGMPGPPPCSASRRRQPGTTVHRRRIIMRAFPRKARRSSVFTLDAVLPWGRSFDEYRRMFALTDADCRRRLLGCADGPASFNAEATPRGIRVTSCDPLYRCTADQIRLRIAASFDEVIEQTRR